MIAFAFSFAHAGTNTDQRSENDAHTTIYTAKLIAIVNALNVGQFDSEKAYQEQLKVACDRNRCTKLEQQTIQSIGHQIINCKLTHLKAHGIINSDANNLCQADQAILGCDSLPNSLLRKMCYTSNKYSLQTLKVKEQRLSKRRPASK